MTKVVFISFRSEPMCFMHAMLNALDLEEKGMWGEIIFEGEATGLIPLISREDHFLYPLYSQARNRGIFYGACQACSAKMKATDAVRVENIPLVGEMSGHPPMTEFIKQGYTIITI